MLPGKMYLSIGELAKRVGVSIDTLRRWEKKGYIKSQRTEGKHRRYHRKLIKILKK